jgi:hypothetical protein
MTLCRSANVCPSQAKLRIRTTPEGCRGLRGRRIHNQPFLLPSLWRDQGRPEEVRNLLAPVYK